MIFFTRLSRLLTVLTSTALAIVTLLTFVIVVMRYIFNTSFVSMQECVLYLHSMIFLFGAALAVSEDGHVRVDVLYHKMSERKKALVNLFGTLFLLWPFIILIFWQSYGYVGDSWRIRETSPDPGGLPLVFVLKTMLPLFSILVGLMSLSTVLKTIKILRKPNHGT